MYLLTKLKQQGLAFAAFFYALAITNIDCYSKSIVPMVDGSRESNSSWTMQGVTQSNDIFHMNAPNSYIETKDFIDLKYYKEITVSIKCKASGSKENSALNLQVSDDGINWTNLKEYDIEKEYDQNKKDIIEKNYSFKYEDFIAHDKVKLRYYCPITNDMDYLNVTSINIGGIIKSIEYPQITGTKQIGGHSFNIDWQPIDNANSYQLALYKKVNKESNYNVIEEDFSTLSLVEGSFDNIDKYLPHWSTKGCNFIIEEDNQYISILGDNKKNIIEISELDLSNNNRNYTVSFDYWDQKANFSVVGNYDEAIESPYRNCNSWKHYSTTFSNGNKNSKVIIRMGDSPRKSEVMIDNLLITQNRPYSYEMVSGYPITVENRNNYKFDCLEPNSEYCCTVIAANELATSKVSDPITFKTAAEKEIHTGINSTSQDNIIIRASEGYLHINSPVVTKVNVYSIIGKLIYTEQGNSIYEIPLPEGMYIVKCDNKTTKISIY